MPCSMPSSAIESKNTPVLLTDSLGTGATVFGGCASAVAGASILSMTTPTNLRRQQERRWESCPTAEARRAEGRAPDSSSGARVSESEQECRRWESNPHGG